jgi:predicted DCC family thiol-disulfide oxidoreductase YuxK
VTGLLRHKRLIVYYDGWCSLCGRSAAGVARLDWLRLLEFVSFRDPAVVERDHLDLERLRLRMQSRPAQDGPISEGIDAVIQVAWRVPLLWPALPLLLLARWIGVGQVAYDWVAARRHGRVSKRRP